MDIENVTPGRLYLFTFAEYKSYYFILSVINDHCTFIYHNCLTNYTEINDCGAKRFTYKRSVMDAV